MLNFHEVYCYQIEVFRLCQIQWTCIFFLIEQTGGLSNRQKEHKKSMPLAAKRNRVARSQVEKRKKKQQSGKQFRGRKAWQ